jgi:hypothetical protein
MALITQQERSTTPVSVLTTELNSLANGSNALSAAVSNETNGDLAAQFEIACTFASAPSAGQPVELYLVQTVDGTNYEDGASGASAATPPVPAWVFSSRAATTLRQISPLLPLPPRDFKILLKNGSGQAMTASGHTLKMYAVSEQAL